MFNRSRRRIILSIMGSLILLFVAALLVILLASYREIRQKNSDMLDRYVQMYSLEQQTGNMEEPEPKPGSQSNPAPEEKPGKRPIDDRPDYQLSTFYSVAMAEDGTVLAVDNGEKEIYSEEDLTELAQELLAGNKESGRDGSLFYMISHRDGYTLVAFLDNTVAEGSMNTLLRNYLIVGGAAIVILFFISLFLSKRIIRPLEENDRRQKQFISDAGHELKTPVAVIGANAELLSREVGPNEWLSNIQYENERMGTLVKQLLDLSRAENTETVMEMVDLSRIVTGEVLAFESLAFEQGKMIQSDIAENIRLSGSEVQLTQLTSILLDNAIRYATGSEIELSLKAQAGMAVLSVVNEGDEIPPEKQAHLFDRFYRIDEARSGDEKHYGLGLSIAKAIVLNHKGSISVSCRDAKIRFAASLPIRQEGQKDHPTSPAKTVRRSST